MRWCLTRVLSRCLQFSDLASSVGHVSASFEQRGIVVGPNIHDVRTVGPMSLSVLD